MRLPSSLAVLVAGLAQTQAQYLINELSFGQGERIAPPGSRSIPNFSLQGRNNPPELLSNKVILTPIAPGNQRGAVWTDKTLQNANWITDVEFRANGPERGGGNFNIWLVRDGSHVIGSDSVYTAGRFEGLALVIDQHSGSGGMLRGFLNDGSTDYRNHHNIDSLAFGHCAFSYRNLGRPTQIKLRHSDTKFSVEVAGRPCFETDKVRLPSGYNFGVTAASADNPDSFEVFKLVVLTGESSHEYANTHNTQHQTPPQGQTNDNSQQDQKQQHMVFGRSGQSQIEDPFDTVIPDKEADTITSSKAQFADLHNRLQSVNHHLSTIFRTIAQNSGVDEQRHAETFTTLSEIKNLITDRLSGLDAMEKRLGDVERELRSLRHELTGRMRDSENAIKFHVSDKHETLQENVKAHAKSGHMRLILVVVGSQVVLVGAFAYYKRRKTMPKKYL